jgi:hypothetical protein
MSSPSVSVVKRGQASEIDWLPGGVTIARMGTPDYWIYSIGLVLVTVAVLVA